MIRAAALLSIILLCSTSLAAQTPDFRREAGLARGADEYMSDAYLEERERRRLDSPYGIGFEIDLFAYGVYFQQEQKVRGSGVSASATSFEDFGGFPLGVFLDSNLRLRWSWWDSVEVGFSFASLRGFEGELDRDIGFNGFVFPEGVDGDYGSDWFEFHAAYRRDLFRVGPRSNFNFFIQAGLEYNLIIAKLDSDDFPVGDNRDTEVFRELLPTYLLGLGFDWEFAQGFWLRLDGYGSYMAGFPTLQRRDGDEMRQSITSITGRASFEWRPIEYFALIAGVRYRYLKVRLYGGDQQDNFLWWSVGPELGIGARF